MRMLYLCQLASMKLTLTLLVIPACPESDSRNIEIQIPDASAVQWTCGNDN